MYVQYLYLKVRAADHSLNTLNNVTEKSYNTYIATRKKNYYKKPIMFICLLLVSNQVRFHTCGMMQIKSFHIIK